MKLTYKNKLGYASASLGDAATYAFIGTFLMFFLTTVADINPITAGSLVAIGSIWDTVWSPIVGFWSDNTKSKMGRRRPFLFFSAFPLALTTCMLFTSFDASDILKTIYYGIMVVLFWTAFTSFFAPYMALGAEYTKDYDERTVLRSYAYGFNLLGTVVGMVLPNFLVDYLCNLGMTTGSAWQITAAFVGIIAAISIWITALLSKGKDKWVITNREKQNTRPGTLKMIMEYMDVLRLKPIRFCIGASISYLIASTMHASARLYFFRYNLNLSAGQITSLMMISSLIGVIFIPIVKILSKKFDKRSTMIIMVFISAVLGFLWKFVGINSFIEMIIFTFVFGFSSGCYWQIMPAMIYDVCEYDEMKTGKRREGIIISLQSLSEALSVAIAMQLVGIVLGFAGFDGEAFAQSKNTLVWIENIITIIPSVFMILMIIMVYKYPITKKVYQDITKILSERSSSK